jgi:hypothetical protein
VIDRFRDHQRIVVTHPDNPLVGHVGTVMRLRRADGGAWVRMDDPVPADRRVFPGDDDRANNVLLFPEDCELAPATGAPQPQSSDNPPDPAETAAPLPTPGEG